MADLKFKQNGLRVLDSRSGDLMIVDPRLNMTCMFTAEFLKQAEEDPQKMAWLGKKFFDFLAKHTEARWRIVKSELDTIADVKFKSRMMIHVQADTIEALRKIEKDIFFFKQKNAQNS